MHDSPIFDTICDYTVIMSLNSQNLKPEERARVKIDEQLIDAGWHICDRNHFTSDHNAVALTEGLLKRDKANLDITWIKDDANAADNRTLSEIFAEIETRSKNLSANVALFKKLLKGIVE